MASGQTAVIKTQIPSRLDRLPWARFHWLIIFGLGTAWILDGLEVTIVGAIASRLTEDGSGANMTAGDIGTAAAIYVIGACLGALVFGQLTDRHGRKKLFMITLLVYIAATAATAFSFAPWYFYLFRFLTGAGIGGEYAAINSAIDELIPARVRGRIDLIINGSFWVGSILGSLAALLFLDESLFAKDLGWRYAFGLGVIVSLAVLVVRRHVPESPRWLFIHGQEDEAERLVSQIETSIEEETGQQLRPVDKTLTVRQRHAIPFRDIARVAFKVYPQRSILCIALFIGQAFIYNGVTFNLGTLMTTFFAVASGAVPIFTIVYAASNFVGPLTLGRLFDTIGRKPMVTATYLGSAAVAVVLGLLFGLTGILGPWTFIIIVMGVFFLASAGASAAYLTASEIFPMETRALAIAFFYAIGTAAGGIAGPLLFGNLIGSKDRHLVMVAFFIGAAVMSLGGVAEIIFGVAAEGAQLEDIAKPLTVEDAEEGGAAQAQAGVGDAGSEERAAASRARAEAARERARAAQHRAATHDLLAEASCGDAYASERADVEAVLAEIAETRANADDEHAAAHDEFSSAAAMDGGGATSRHRGEAAEQRARAYEHEAAALGAETERETARLKELAAAASERARASEQRALIGQRDEIAVRENPDGGPPADAKAATAARNRSASNGHIDDQQGLVDEEGEVARAQTEMHEAWARVHDARAEAHQRRAEGDDAAAGRAENTAQILEQRAQAASLRLDAARFLANAIDEEHEEEREEEKVREAERKAEERRAREAADQRLRERIERRRAAERHGLRRFRPGPGRISGSPGLAVTAPYPQERLDNEISAIEQALREHGATERRELAMLVGARYWGPGAFREALREAVAEGAVRRVSAGSYQIADEQ